MIYGVTGEKGSEFIEECGRTWNETPSYGFTVTQTSFYGQRDRWTVQGCATLAEAKQKAWDWALGQGWTPPKWWQWWRRNDSQFAAGDALKGGK